MLTSAQKHIYTHTNTHTHKHTHTDKHTHTHTHTHTHIHIHIHTRSEQTDRQTCMHTYSEVEKDKKNVFKAVRYKNQNSTSD